MPTVVSIPLPISSVGSLDAWSLTGAATKVAAVTDNNDSSYIYTFANTSDHQEFNSATPFISPVINEMDGSITGIKVTVKAQDFAGQGYWVKLQVGSHVTAEQGHFPPTFGTDSFTFTFTGSWTFSDLLSVKVTVRPNIVNRKIAILKIDVSADLSVDSYLNAPTGLAITADDYNFVTLEWNDNSAVETGYQIRRSKNGAAWETIATVGPDSESYTDNTVLSVTPYEYTVRAINSSHPDLISPESSIVSITTDAPSGPPLAPSGLEVVAKTPTTLPLVWFVDNDLANTYEVQRSADNGTTWIETVTVQAPSQTYTFKVLPGSTYTFRVRGVNSLGNSAYSSNFTATAPEESFRNFLENEVLQDTAYYLRWFDRVNINPEIFTVTQSIHFVSDIDVPDLVHLAQRDTAYVSFYRSEGGEVLIDRLLPLISATGGLDSSFNVDFVEMLLRPGDLIGIARIPPYTTKVRLDSPLTMDVPKGTVFWTNGGGSLRFLVGNEDIISAKSADDTEYFDEAITLGAKVGETLIQVDYQTNSGGGWSATKQGYPMGVVAVSGGVHGVFQKGTVTSGTFEVTLPVDHDVEPFNAAPIYDSITTEALLRLGYTNDADVPAAKYQQLRDAGRVEAWRAVAYATLAKQKVVIDNVWKSLDEIHEYAARQLSSAETLYLARYATATAPAAPVKKPVLTSYSSVVEVRF